MALGEETILDAPVTPAPVFAYRALRAVIWGEEDTPEPAAKNVESASDKINDSSKGLRDDGRKAQMQLTPSQKRKRSTIAQPSPSKSILRTPGVNTPRRALLRDMNVTFKDLRKSISPEIVRKEPNNSVASHNLNQDEKENKPAGLNTKITRIETEVDPMKDFFSITRLPIAGLQPQPQPTSQERVLKTMAQAPVQSTSAPIAISTDTKSFDIDAYMRNTEKEMKRLIKYGQKMREYARRQDEENTKLRLMLDEMREENNRLKLRPGESEDVQNHVMQNLDDDNGHMVRTKASSTVPLDQQQQQSKPDSSNARSRSVKPTAQTHSSNNTSNDAAVPTTKLQSNRDSESGSKPSTSMKPNTIETRTKRPLPNSYTNQISIQDPSASPSPTKKRRSSNPYLTSLSSTTTTVRNPPQAQNQEAKDNLNCNTNSDNHTNHTTHPAALHPLANGLSSIANNIINKQNTGLAPDRLAAARARVKRRAELRKTSSGDAGDEKLGTVKDWSGNGNGNGSRVETSLVDWAGL